MRGRTAWAAPAGSLAAALLAGCGLIGPSLPILAPDELDTAPVATEPVMGGAAPVGPVVEVARGTEQGSELSVTVWEEADGLCIDAEVEGQRTVTCGELPDDSAADAFGVVGIGEMWAGGPNWAYGAVRADVADVVVEEGATEQGRAALIALEPIGVGANLFLVVLPVEIPDLALVARDASGAELGRLGISVPMVNVGRARAA